MRLISILGAMLVAMLIALAPPAVAQEGAPDRASTGGAQTLEDILARQRGEEVPTRARDGAAGEAAAIAGQLGIRGSASDSELWEALRYGSANITTQASNPEVSSVLVQDGGMWWREFREGPLREWGGNLLLLTLLALGFFYFIRGRIRIDGGRAGIKLLSFRAWERFGHWLLAGSFILLAITGIVTLFGRVWIIPWVGHEAFSTVAIASKWVHNNVAWAFMIGLVWVFVAWVFHNIPNRHDLKWLMQGGGIFSKGAHPPAKKFNAGQKIIFWAVIILGGSVSLSGLALLFPFELPMFAKTFAILNGWGVPGLFGFDPLPVAMTPHQEMQYSTLWHSIVAFIMMAIIMAHIYLGSIGMEGAYEAMGSGEVDLQWAREHHNLWVEKITHEKVVADPPPATPAE